MARALDPKTTRIAIIGAGPGGLCMGLKLKEAGFENFVLLEQGSGVGGTWYHNRYPGCACDLPSYFYSFSFEPKLDWSRPYGTQPEILEYMEGISEKYGLMPHCRFDCGVEKVDWDETRSLWKLSLAGGDRLEAEILVSAIGMFNDLVFPGIDGLDSFEGTQFHSARWDHDVDLKGKTVGVIGSAASAVQFIPEIVKEASQVYLYQRTANWVLPKQDEPYTDAELAHFKSNPSALAELRAQMYSTVDEGMTFANSAMLAEMEIYGRGALDVVEDPDVRDQLRPQHPYGCKRPLLSNVFYASFNRPNLELVTESIDRITPRAIVTTDDKSREVDVIVLATGFSATKYLSALDVTGRDGVHIDEAWEDGAAAFLGMTTAGFPNLFMLYGPNMNNGSILEMIENQVAYIIDQIQTLERDDLAWIDVKKDHMDRYNEAVQQAVGGVQVWQESCNGYYKSKSGRIVTQWPYSMTEFIEKTKEPADDAFHRKTRS